MTKVGHKVRNIGSHYKPGKALSLQPVRRNQTSGSITEKELSPANKLNEHPQKGMQLADILILA